MPYEPKDSLDLEPFDMDCEYHRRRAEKEAECALQAEQMDEAVRHLELARIHRDKRNRLSIDWNQAATAKPTVISRTDKES